LAEHNEIGERGELIAQRLMADKGYKIEAVNWTFQKAELDIVCKTKTEIVFVEVKTRTSRYFENPKDAVTRKKQKNIIRAAHAYIEQANCDLEARFDIVSILLEGKKEEIEHIEDAFYPLL
jgi:putative endonuclease